VSKIVQSARSQALCRIGRFRAPRLRFQIGASKLRHFFGDPDDKQAHQIAVLIGYPNDIRSLVCPTRCGSRGSNFSGLPSGEKSHGSGLSTGQRETASRSSIRNAPPVQIA
jgi:hypothetical protein